MYSYSLLKQKMIVFLNRPNLRAVLIITFFSFVSRALGMLRQILVYNRMDKISSDLLIASDKIPANIAQLLITGAIISSVLPVASRLETDTKDNKEVSKYLNLMLIGLLGIIFLINLTVLVFTPQILSLPFVTSSTVLNSFKDAGVLEDYFAVTRILLIGPLLFAIQAILNVYLFLKKKFFVFAWAGVVYNVGYIAGILLTPRNGYFTTAWGAVVGIFLTTLIYFIEARSSGFKSIRVLLQTGKNKFDFLKLNIAKYKMDLTKTWQVFVPRIFILDSVISANLLITPIAQNSGQITAVDIALSVQGAFYIIISSLSTVIFPDLAKLMNEKKNRFWPTLGRYTKNAVLISLVVTILTILGAPLIMYIFSLFGKGQNSEQYIVLVAQTASIGIVFRAFREIISKYFYVKERLWQPALLSMGGILVQVFATYFLYLMKVDSGINVAITLTINNIAWSALAFWLVWKDWKSHQAENLVIRSQ
jgi:peptidoglycan biosynthesis protein MviN/MurJ (putative lipid II flippase)